MTETSLERVAPRPYRLTGPITYATVTRLYEDAALEFESGQTLELDLGAAARVDSAGIALLVEWTKMAASAGARMRIDGMPAQLERLVRVTGLNGVLIRTDSDPTSTMMNQANTW